MASEKGININSQYLGYNNSSEVKIITNQNNDEQFQCDSCGSYDIAEVKEGYVCRNCGICLEIQKLEYHKPYNLDASHSEILCNYTLIGSTKERKVSPLHHRLRRLQKHQMIVDNKKNIELKAKIEISRIFNGLMLPDAKKEHVFKRFIQIRAKIRPSTKYRSIEKLIPITIYYWCKYNNISINENELLKISKISKKDFRTFKLEIQNYMEDYRTRDRKSYIFQKILEISQDYDLGMDFFYTAKKVLYKFWDLIKSTTDNVIAGLVSSITALCSFKEKISVSIICSKLGIMMSTIQIQVQKHIFNHFKVEGFKSLVKSTDLLKQVMHKLGIINDEIKTEETENNDIVEIKLGNAIQVFNHFNKQEYYLLVLKNKADTPLMVSIELKDINQDIKQLRKKIPYPTFKCDLKFLRYKSVKGPPLEIY